MAALPRMIHFVLVKLASAMSCEPSGSCFDFPRVDINSRPHTLQDMGFDVSSLAEVKSCINQSIARAGSPPQ